MNIPNMTKRIKKVLINPSQEEIFDREPLMAFSFYLSGRNNVLLSIGDEIIELLDEGFSGQPVHGAKIEHAESLMWLWILGAYEVIRTMCQAKECFSPEFYSKVSSFKKNLAEVRMPAAKMEKKGQKIPVTSNRSPSGWNISNKDILVNDPEDDKSISARTLIGGYDSIISSLTIKRERSIDPYPPWGFYRSWYCQHSLNHS